MKTAKIPLETERFVDLARKLVAVPKEEVDKRIAEKREAKDNAKNKKRKA
jgi:hypothetical protein